MATRIPVSSPRLPSLPFSITRASLAMRFSPEGGGSFVHANTRPKLLKHLAQQVGDGVYRGQRGVGQLPHAGWRFLPDDADAERLHVFCLAQAGQSSEGMRVGDVIAEVHQAFEAVFAH